MAPRRLTISCPGCRVEFKDILVDEAERILFNGCTACRDKPSDERSVLNVVVEKETGETAEDNDADEANEADDADDADDADGDHDNRGTNGANGEGGDRDEGDDEDAQGT